MNARETALSVLRKCESGKTYSNLALDAALRRNPLSEADRALCTRIVYGVTEHKLTLNYLIDRLSDRPPEAIDDWVRTVLQMGVYQLRYLDRVPDHAAINETVTLAPKKSTAFVNALLRAYTRKGAEILMPDRKTEPLSYLSVCYSIPVDLCRRFLSVYGFEKTERIFEAFSHVPPIALRVNTRECSPAQLIERLKTESGVEATPSPLLPHALRVYNANVASLPSFAEGAFFVQDEASQLCVEAMGVEPGFTVIDTCACPGSKSFGAAINMNDEGKIYDFDLHESKLSLIRSGAQRLHLSIITPAVRDGREEDETLLGCADCVLCDVPCSGFGVMAKKPEIRYKDLSQITALPAIGAAILSHSANYVKPGGILVYSTCTLLPEENEDNMRAFLAAHPNFSLCPFTAGSLSVPQGYITLTPDQYGTDGFFIAKMKRALDS